MTGGKNILDYITTEGKRVAKNEIEQRKKDEKNGITALEYLQKSTGVFNRNGMIEKEELEAIKKRAAKNEGHIWSGFISLNEEESHKIDTPEKCINLVKRTFGKFFKDAHIKEDNVDLMCALHLDRPHHLHIHFIFFEKEPIYNYNGKMQYRRKGKIEQSAIDNMLVSLGLTIDDRKDRLYKSRDAAIKELREMTAVKAILTSEDEIKKQILSLAKDLPKTGRLSYGSKDMEPFRGRVDHIVQMLLNYDEEAQKADRKFYKALAEREQVVANTCGKPFAFSDGTKSDTEVLNNLPKYNRKIDESNIKIIEEIKADYKRRQGNLVLNLAKFIKPEIFEKTIGRKYKANDDNLKRRQGISRKKIDFMFKKFIKSFGKESENASRESRNRLREIEDEMKREKEAEKREIQKEESLNNWIDKRH